MSDLAEFLLARIAEDEQRAKDARGYQTGSRYEGQPLDWQLHMERWSPAHVLAECEAKRRIVEQLCGGVKAWEDADRYGESQDLVGPDPVDLLRLFALPYADHPDYREEWRP